MRNDQELEAKRQELEGAVEAINRSPEDEENKIRVSKFALFEMLNEGVDAIDELERLRKAVGPSYLNQVEVVVDGLKKERP